MTNFKVLAAAALLSMASSPVFAQAAIQEPCAFAFYHPNADVLNAGVPTSYPRPPAAAFMQQWRAPASFPARSAAVHKRRHPSE